MQKRLITLALLILSVFVTGSAAIAQFNFATDTNQDLYRVDVTTGTAALVGHHGKFLEGLAISPSGQLFGTDSGGNLYSINSTTAAATLIGNTGRGNIEGLDFVGGTLVGVDFSSTPTVFSINTSTAATTNIVTAGTSTGSVRAMAPKDGNNLFVRTDGPVNNSLQVINLTTGAVTDIGQLPGDIDAGMDFGSDGNLYTLDDNGNVYRINTSTGAGTLVGNTGRQFWLDATPSVTVVPEGGSLALMFAGVIPMAIVPLRRLRRNR